MPTPIPHFLDGKLTPGSSGRTGAVFNPATGVQTGAVDLASAAEVDTAAASAVAAFPAWRATPLARRTDRYARRSPAGDQTGSVSGPSPLGN